MKVELEWLSGQPAHVRDENCHTQGPAHRAAGILADSTQNERPPLASWRTPTAAMPRSPPRPPSAITLICWWCCAIWVHTYIELYFPHSAGPSVLTCGTRREGPRGSGGQCRWPSASGGRAPHCGRWPRGRRPCRSRPRAQCCAPSSSWRR